MKKNIIAALMITAMTAAAAGCGGNSQTATSAPDTAAAGSSQSESGGESSGAADSENSAVQDGASYTIGIGQYAVHGSLDNCREGFLQGLAEEGIEEGKNLTVLYENANGDGGMGTQIVSNFLSQDVDMVCAIATPMAQTAYGATKRTDIPVIYTAVTDPVIAQLATEDKMPAGNITGTSDKLPVEEQLQMIRQILPDAKTIGIMYSTSEVNSQSTLEEYKEAAPEYGFEIVESGVSTAADIPLAADNLLAQVDCLNNLTDNTVVSSLPHYSG